MATNDALLLKLKELDSLAAQGNAEAAADAKAIATILENRKSAAIPPAQMGYGEDMLRSVPSGLKAGTEAMIGSAEDTPKLGTGLLQRTLARMGVGATHQNAAARTLEQVGTTILNPVAGMAKGIKAVGGPDLTSLYSPSTEQARSAINTIPGAQSLEHKPETTPGEYVHTGSSFVPMAVAGKIDPKAILGRAAELYGAGLASEGAGQATEGSDLEPYARVLGGLAGGTLLSSGFLRKGPMTPEAEAQIGKGNRWITAGQATANRGLMRIERMFGGGKVDDMIARQGEHYTGQAMADIGLPGALMTPGNMLKGLEGIQGKLNSVESGLGRVAFSPQNLDELRDIMNVFAANTGPNRPPVVRDILTDMGSMFRSNAAANPGSTGHALTGPQLMELRKNISSRLDTADGQTQKALKKIQEAIDRNTDIHITNNQPDLAGVWQEGRTMYRKFLDLENALTMVPMDDFARGTVTPAALRGGVNMVEGERRLATKSGEFGDLAREGAAAMPRIPTSGTAENVKALTQGASILTGDPLTTGAAITGPSILGKILMSPPMQSILKSSGNNYKPLLDAYVAAQAEQERLRRPKQ